METLLPAWLANSLDAFRRLADRPFTLFVLLLAVNALARPCANCTHDARLYGLQVLNRAEGGAFGDDVFLRFGSQDQFSVFSRLAAPLAELGGVRLTFFVLYVLFNTYFVWSLFRLIRILFADPFLSTSALIYLVSADLYYGGHNIFTVHEQFFTPRLVASALVLHALERLLVHRFAASGLLLVIAMGLHPLMALGGVLIWIGYLAHLMMTPRFFWGSLAGATIFGASLLIIQPAGERLFGQMDDEWHEMVRLTVMYNYPDAWSPTDWLNHVLAFGFCVAGFAWLLRDDPIRARFLFIATLVGIIGLAATALAAVSPYALLFQGQPYRVVWILKVLQVPLGFCVIGRLSQSSAVLPRLVALALSGYFLLVSFAINEAVMFLFVLPVAAFYWRWMEEPIRADWWWHAGAMTLVGGAAGWMLYRWGFVISQREMILSYYDSSELYRVFSQCIPAGLWVALLLLAMRWFAEENLARGLRWGCAVAALAITSAHFAMDANATTRSQFTRHGADVEFARQAIEARAGARSRPPTVYLSLGHVEYTWLDLRATSYFDAVQTAGVMFNRKTADELHRRIALVRNFEMARLRKEEVFLSPDAKGVLERLYGAQFSGPAPTEEDVVRLCQDPGLDYIVVPHEFPGLPAATNGRIFVYECKKVRTYAGLAFTARPALSER